MRWVLALAALLVAGCGPEDVARKAASSVSTAVPTPVAGPAVCGASSDGPVPPLAALAALGRPIDEQAFDLTEPLTEFRVRLLNHYVLPRDRQTRIRERTWARGPCRLTIWFAEQGSGIKPVDWLRWNEGDLF